MKNKGILFLFIGFLMAIFIGCTSETEVVVGISIGPDQERWQKDTDLLTERLEREGIKVLVKQANNTEAMQYEQIDELLKHDLSVLIVVPVNSDSCGKIICEAKKFHEDLKVIAYDRIIRNCEIDFYVSFDNVKVGEMQADYLTKVKPKGNYVILGGSPNDDNSRMIRLGQLNILHPLMLRGDINIILDENVEEWRADRAYEIMEKFLENNKDIDAVVAASDEIAQGVSKALQKFDMSTKVLLSGQDAQIDACKRIVEGKQTMTVYKFIESLAHTTAKVALNLIKEEPIPNSYVTVNNGEHMVPSILLPSMIQVNNENLRMTVIADGYLDEKEVFGN